MVRPAPITYAEVEPIVRGWYPRMPETASRAGIGRWLELLCEWNARIDLTAARTPGELVDLMLADALAIGAMLAPGARVVDVGTGAGAPGLALAFLRPDLAVTLCEPLVKRASFLRTVIGSVGRTDIALAAKRGEDLLRDGAGQWDVAMSRATLAPEDWLAMGMKLARADGDVWVLLAAGDPPTVAGATLGNVTRYTWPETSAQRSAARYTVSSR